MWDTRTGRQLHLLTGHQDEVLDVTFDPSGRRLASASADGTARVWNVGISGETKSAKFLSTLIGHEGEVSKVSYLLLLKIILSLNMVHSTSVSFLS